MILESTPTTDVASIATWRSTLGQPLDSIDDKVMASVVLYLGAEPQSKAPTQPPTQTPAPPPKPPLSDTAKRFRKLAEELDKEGGQ